MKVADPRSWRGPRGRQEAIRTGLVTPGGTTDSSVLPARRNATEFAYECTRFTTWLRGIRVVHRGLSEKGRLERSPQSSRHLFRGRLLEWHKSANLKERQARAEVSPGTTQFEPRFLRAASASSRTRCPHRSSGPQRRPLPKRYTRPSSSGTEHTPRARLGRSLRGRL